MIRKLPFEQVSTIRWRSPGPGFLDGITLANAWIAVFGIGTIVNKPAPDTECFTEHCWMDFVLFSSVFALTFGGIGALFGGKYEVKVVS